MADLTTITKWGNSQGIRLPKTFCDQLELKVGDKVSLALEGNRIIISPPEERYTLKARLQQWDGKRTQTQEYDWGTPSGKEVW